MPILFTPFSATPSMARPLQYVFFQAQNAPGEPIVSALVEVRVNNITLATEQIQPFAVAGLFVVFSLFRIDVSRYLQRSTAPNAASRSTVFGESDNNPYNVVNNDAFADVELILSYQYINSATNRLETQAGTESTGIQQSFIGQKPLLDQDTSLDSYILATGAPPQPFLTTVPNNQKVGVNQSLFISAISRNFGGANQLTCRVRAFNKTNDFVSTAVFNVNSGLVDFEQFTVGVGPKDLQFAPYFSGSINFSDPNIYSYDIQFGLNNFVPVSEIKRFVIDRCISDRNKRIHWLNDQGGTDAYTFTDVQEVVKAGDQIQAQRKLNWDFVQPQYNPFEKSTFNVTSSEQKGLNLKAQVSKTVAIWLSGLLSSNEVYLETENGLFPLIVESGQENNINRKDFTELEIQVSYSQKKYKPSN